MHIAQVRRQFIEDCFAALFVTVRRDHPFRFMKEDKSFDRVMDRLLINRDSISWPQDPCGRIAYNSTIDTDSPSTNPCLARASGGNPTLRKQPVHSETF